MRKLGFRIAVLALLVVAYIVSRHAAPGATPVPPSNPTANVTISQLAWDTCVAGNPHAGIPVSEYPASFNPDSLVNTPACNSAVLQQINERHRAEGVRPMVLPTDFASLSPAMQLLVVANAERTSRGLPPIAGVVASLNRDSQVAARQGIDPNPSNADGPWTVYDSIWAGGYPSALLADFDWMYNDGWGGNSNSTINLDCPSATAKGCWGHRDAILDNYQLSQSEILVGGAAVVTTGPSSLALPSLAAAFEAVPRASVKIEARISG